MVKAKECVLVNPGLRGLGTTVIDAEELSQVWRVTFDDGFVGDICISATEAVRYKGKVTDMVIELAEFLHEGSEQFPYSTNNLSATLSPYRHSRR
jgi:hypothetical protein